MKLYEAIGNLYDWHNVESKMFIIGIVMAVIPLSVFFGSSPLKTGLFCFQMAGFAMWVTAVIIRVVKNIKNRREYE